MMTMTRSPLVLLGGVSLCLFVPRFVGGAPAHVVR